MRALIFNRGGARPRRCKISKVLTLDEVRKIDTAIRAAIFLGMPFNRFITIHWERGDVAEIDAAKATTAFLKYARDYLAGKGFPFAYVWVRENDEGDGSKGHHVHILAYLPKGQSLGHLQRRWIKCITGKPYRKRIILTRSIARHSQAAQKNPKL